MQKKITILFLIVTLLIIPTGCSNEAVDPEANVLEESSRTEEEKNEENEESEEAYTYLYDGIEIELNTKAEPILNQLGDTISYFESESCAFPGLDKVYTYPGLEIQTYEKEGVDHILSINIIDDTIATTKGIRLFDSYQKVIDTYGKSYDEQSGYYVYTKGKTKLSFLIKDDAVVAIEYAAIVNETN